MLKILKNINPLMLAVQSRNIIPIISVLGTIVIWMILTGFDKKEGDIIALAVAPFVYHFLANLLDRLDTKYVFDQAGLKAATPKQFDVFYKKKGIEIQELIDYILFAKKRRFMGSIVYLPIVSFLYAICPTIDSSFGLVFVLSGILGGVNIFLMSLKPSPEMGARTVITTPNKLHRAPQEKHHLSQEESPE